MVGGVVLQECVQCPPISWLLGCAMHRCHSFLEVTQKGGQINMYLANTPLGQPLENLLEGSYGVHDRPEALDGFISRNLRVKFWIPNEELWI